MLLEWILTVDVSGPQKAAALAGHDLAEGIRYAISIGVTLAAGAIAALVGARAGAAAQAEYHAKLATEEREAARRDRAVESATQVVVYFLRTASELHRAEQALRLQNVQVEDGAPHGSVASVLQPIHYRAPIAPPDAAHLAVLALPDRFEVADQLLELQRRCEYLEARAKDYRGCLKNLRAYLGERADATSRSSHAQTGMGFDLVAFPADYSAKALIQAIEHANIYAAALALPLRSAIEAALASVGADSSRVPSISPVSEDYLQPREG